MIQVEDLYKKFGKNHVLQGVELSIDKPGIYAILGPNSSGKTTLIKSILGMVLPDQGKIEVAGENINGQWKYRSGINYLPQIANFPPNLRVGELLNMIKDLRTTTSDELRLVERFELSPFLDKKLSYLSGGTKQKVNIVLTFMFSGDIFILDEPTTGLDPSALLVLYDLIREQKAMGKTIIITTHIMQFVEEMAEEIVYLLGGKIYFKGSIAELVSITDESDFQHAIAEISKSHRDA